MSTHSVRQAIARLTAGAPGSSDPAPAVDDTPALDPLDARDPVHDDSPPVRPEDLPNPGGDDWDRDDVAALFSDTTAGGRRKQRALVRTLIAEKHDPHGIASVLGIPPRQARKLYDEILADDASTLEGRSAGEAFAEYRLRQLACISDLADLYDGDGPSSTKVGAVKAQAAILDRIMAVGQELGIIEKDRGRFMLDGDDVTDMDLDELRVTVFQAVKRTRSIVAEGDGDILALPEPELYPTAPPAPPVRRRAGR